MTDEFQSQFDIVFPLLRSVPYGVGYNDNTGLRLGDLNYYREYPILEVDGGGIDPYQAMREYVETRIEDDYNALMAKAPKEIVFTPTSIEYMEPDPTFIIRSATMYRRVLPGRDTYEFWLALVV